MGPKTYTTTAQKEDGFNRYDVISSEGVLVGVLRSNDPGVVSRWFAYNFPGVELPPAPAIKLNWKKDTVC